MAYLKGLQPIILKLDMRNANLVTAACTLWCAEPLLDITGEIVCHHGPCFAVVECPFDAHGIVGSNTVPA